MQANVYYAKDVFKTAFKVGFGFAVGKYVGGLLNRSIDGTITGTLKCAANHGNKTAEEALKNAGVKIEHMTGKNEDRIKMGFHSN